MAPPPHTGAGRVSVMSEAALLPQKRASLTGESHDQHLALPSMYCQKKKKKSCLNHDSLGAFDPLPFYC